MARSLLIHAIVLAIHLQVLGGWLDHVTVLRLMAGTENVVISDIPEDVCRQGSRDQLGSICFGKRVGRIG